MAVGLRCVKCVAITCAFVVFPVGLSDSVSRKCLGCSGTAVFPDPVRNFCARDVYHTGPFHTCTLRGHSHGGKAASGPRSGTLQERKPVSLAEADELGWWNLELGNRKTEPLSGGTAM